MKKSRWIGLPILILATSSAFALTPTGASSNTNNFLGGIGHLQFTHDLSDNTAFMVAGEAGPRNYRGSATFGWDINDTNRLKLTGEYLTQDIDYTFFSGVSRQWVEQGAGGLDYQHALGGSAQSYFNLKAFYSYAPSVNLSTVTGTFTPSSGILTSFTDLRHIAGSDAGGVAPGFTTHPWHGGEATFSVNWDDVVYRNIYSAQQKAEGLGGKLSVSQLFHIHAQQFQLGASAADRAPFNNYTGELDWIKPNSPNKLTVGVFGGYVQGKVSLPSTSIVGVNLAFAMDAPAESAVHSKPQGVEPDSFTSWMSEPAVYMPQVLAIPEDSVTTACAAAAPTFTGSIASLSGLTPGSTVTFNSPTQFVGSNLTYTQTSSATGITPATVTINSTTGVVTVTGSRSTATITITATNPCGVAVSSNTFTATFI